MKRIIALLFGIAFVYSCSTSTDSNEITTNVTTSPTNLIATSSSLKKVDLSWSDNSNNEQGFTIERKTFGSYTEIYRVQPNITNYTDLSVDSNTTYTYRVYSFKYASNMTVLKSIQPSNEATIATKNFPTLTSTTVSNLTHKSVTTGGNISSDGGFNITARGVVWNTIPQPTIDLSTKTNDGTGSGTFTSNIIGLIPNTTYYIRSYATNTYGTAYGNEIIFTTNSNKEVYASGFEYDRAIILKNNQKILTNTLGGSGLIPSTVAKSVYVNGTDVYAAGYTAVGSYTKSVLWKNDTPTYLEQTGGSDGFNPAISANSVFVSGTNVYVVGKGLKGATLWKNNIATILTSQNDYSGNAKAVYVSGSDVYVIGVNYTDTRLDGGGPVIWKNGVMSYLNQNGGSGVANSLFVSAGNVYVAGEIDGNPVFWKNGVVNLLSKTTSNGVGYSVEVNSIFVNGSDVYVAGSMNVSGGLYGAGISAILWKNGIAIELTNPSNNTYTHGIARSVFIDGTDVYVAGIYAGINDTGGDRGFIWNSSRGWIYTSAQRTGLYSIFVATIP